MTFLEGLLSFLSPCMLPMLPVYLVYLAGNRQSGRRGRLGVFINSLTFSLGFSMVFVLLGVFAGSLGAALSAHRPLVNAICGVMMVLFGVYFFGWIHLPTFGSSKLSSSVAGKVRGPLSAFLFGIVFSLGLTPCVGAFLGAALMTAASEGGMMKGALLLSEYSLGLSLPLIISALAFEQLAGIMGFFKAHQRGIAIVSGLLLIAIGIWLGGARDFVRGAQVESSNNQEENKAMEITLNEANFEVEVLKSELPVMVDFWATWCGPCRMLAPELEALAMEQKGILKVGKVNVDECPELCAKYGVTSIPAIFVFKQGKVVAQSVGYQRKDDLLKLFTTAK